MSSFDAGEETLLRVEDVARMLSVDESWVYGHLRKRARDNLPGFKLGKYWRFRREDIEEWVERQKSKI